MSTKPVLKKKVLVVGATGATGKHAVQMLLDKGQNVVAVARSEEKMRSLLKQNEDYGDQLQIKELSISDLSQEEYLDLTKDCDAIVCSLGHNLTFSGMYQDGYFLSTTVKALTEAMPKPTCRFILMGTDGVSNPDGSDPPRSLVERGILFLLRWLVPPHSDNEMTASYLHNHRSDFDWSVVRPTNLINGDVCEYDIFDKQHGSLFGSGVATRANVAHMMVRLVLEDDTWKKYKHGMPILYDKETPKDVVETTATSMGDGSDGKKSK